MTTIANKLTRIASAKEAIKTAIEAKGVEVANAPLAEYAEKIAEIKSGMSIPQRELDVCFYDFDGTLLHTYTKSEFLALNAMPELPTHDGLTCQEWNWTLSQAKEYVEQYGFLNIGATYITDDGYTRIYVRLTEQAREVRLSLYFTDSTMVPFDWGDGSSGNITETSVALNHTYARDGNYVITIKTPASNPLKLSYSLVATSLSGSVKNVITDIRFGHLSYIGSSAFATLYSLRTITLPKGSAGDIGHSTFLYCNALKAVVLPEGITRMMYSVFNNCYSLRVAAIPKSLTDVGHSVWQNCYSLTRITLPSVYFGTQAMFSYCYSLEVATMHLIENSTTEYKQFFQNCEALRSVAISCDDPLYFSNFFSGCTSLASVRMPQVGKVSTSAFYNCKSLKVIYMTKNANVPTLSTTGAFNNMPSGYKIVVPDSLYDNWVATTNWSSISSSIVKESEYVG